MTQKHWLRLSSTLAVALLSVGMVGCAHKPAAPFDYSAYQKYAPKSILVLPPTNQSPDIKASHSLWSHATRPLAESGYYVIPVALVAETLKQNGVGSPEEAQALPGQKLQQIFGADAALYIKVTQFGTQFQVVDSVTTVAADAKLVDLKTGTPLWEGSVRVQDSGSQQQGGLAALVVTAIIKQIANTTTDQSHRLAGGASQQLLQAGRPRGLLWGPRAPEFGTLPPAQ